MTGTGTPAVCPGGGESDTGIATEPVRVGGPPPEESDLPGTPSQADDYDAGGPGLLTSTRQRHRHGD